MKRSPSINKSLSTNNNDANNTNVLNKLSSLKPSHNHQAILTSTSYDKGLRSVEEQFSLLRFRSNMLNCDGFYCASGQKNLLEFCTKICLCVTRACV